MKVCCSTYSEVRNLKSVKVSRAGKATVSNSLVNKHMSGHGNVYHGMTFFGRKFQEHPTLSHDIFQVYSKRVAGQHWNTQNK